MYKVKRHEGIVDVVDASGNIVASFPEDGWLLWKKTEGTTVVTMAAVAQKMTDEDLLKALVTVVKLG